MKMKIVSLCLSLMTSSFAIDEYLPVSKGAWEIDLGYSLENSTGHFNGAGKNMDIQGNPLIHALPVQIKYGFAQGMELDVFLPLAFQNDAAGAKQGMDRPEIALKYARPEWAFGYYLNLILPVALMDYAQDPLPGAGIGLGSIYDNTFSGRYRVVGQASYQRSLSDGDTKNSDVVTLLAKPEFVVDPQVGVYLGLKYNLFTESEFDGVGRGDEGYLLTFFPGFHFQQDKMVSYEMNLPLALLGKNRNASWGLSGSVYFSM